MVSTAKAVLRQVKAKGQNFTWISNEGAGAQVRAALPGTVAASWIRSEAAETWTGILIWNTTARDRELAYRTTFCKTEILCPLSNSFPHPSQPLTTPILISLL